MLSYRLNAIVNMMPKTEIAADIGCDHGKVAVSLIKKGTAERVICTDISEKSLDKARKLVKSRNLDGSVSLREGSGLDVIEPGEADAAVIAGMGGELIADILSKGGQRVPEVLVLSCNTAAGLLRQWLNSNGYVIEDEQLIYEGKHFYPVIRAKKGSPEKQSDIELEFGPVLLKKKPRVLREFLKRRVDTAKDIRKRIEKSGKEDRDKLLLQIDEQLGKYREVQRCLQR